MEAMISRMLPLLQRERAAGRPVALAVVVRTDGSTYSKPGAAVFFTCDGDSTGLLSGGCLENDLCEHARQVLSGGAARLIRYDLRGPDELLFGLGAGCEGAMDIFLMQVGSQNGWQPLAAFQAAMAGHRTTAVGLVIESTGTGPRAGEVLLPGSVPGFNAGLAAAAAAGEPAWLSQTPQLRVFALPLVLPPRILLLGAGRDAVPVLEFALRLNWEVTLYDHRPALTESGLFAGAARVQLGRPEALAQSVVLDKFDAAVVMSHHLDSDAAYLRALAKSHIGYIGLLGPAPRRERLRAALAEEAPLLTERLHAPVGLPLGGRSSASIALAIVAEIHAWLHQRVGKNPV
jgi:xanthine/CO dehydrogenase XdhC/CoxF family maturation factor